MPFPFRRVPDLLPAADLEYAPIMNVEDAVDGDFAQCNIDRQSTKVQPNAGGLVVVLMELSERAAHRVQGGRKRPSPNLLTH